ncbi:MAG: hypothetical protein WBS20_14460, partial [Lysobacterales bacterium]
MTNLRKMIVRKKFVALSFAEEAIFLPFVFDFSGQLQNLSRLLRFVTSRHLVAGLAGVLFAGITPGLHAEGTGFGYVWANSPKQQNYAPDPNYSFNSSGGPISITRSGPGTYKVDFSGLGGHGTAGGHVQVTAYGGGSEQCKVVNWSSGGNSFTINIKCFDVRGRSVDTQYTVHALWPHQTVTLGPEKVREISRSVLPDGKVKLDLSDGSAKILFYGGYTII